ncbi:carboxypeptidase-like regulatory domain-containing protein [uncultured Polaribacter sp.]|uniref:carboxypeptidase-like regulatory domain-containing protein n=1 Tax=uncultured Polaribacter sp. TaxID=174711 RepID=UPI0026393F1C|nr:carboxypeptidase-like regulatory domain-containing protein [uncultured Polaribacter sp.]
MFQKIIFFVLIINISCFAQSKNIFKGTIIDSTHVLKNVHIVNLQNNKGTYTNAKGLFTIPAKIKDSLQISAIGFTTRTIVVKPFHFREKQNIFFLSKATILLDEVVVKNTNLTGFMEVDIKAMKLTYKEKAVKSLMDGLLGLDPFKIANMGIGADETHLIKATKVNLPSYGFGGVGFATSLTSNKKREFAQQLREYQKIPDKLLSELGSYFFFTELKIPKDKYYHFIEYCTFKNLFHLYMEKKLGAVITILKTESKTYLAIIKQE